MTPVQCSKLVAVLLAGFPQARVTDATSALYERMLLDLDVLAAHAAVERLLATEKWLPPIAAIREATLAIALGERRPGGEAWGDVLREIRRVGVNRAPAFEDDLVEKAVHALGWRELCLSESPVADRARFIELYDQLAVTARREYVTVGLPSGERYKQLSDRGETRPVSDAIGRLLDAARERHALPEGPPPEEAVLVEGDAAVDGAR